MDERWASAWPAWPRTRSIPHAPIHPMFGWAAVDQLHELVYRHSAAANNEQAADLALYATDAGPICRDENVRASI